MDGLISVFRSLAEDTLGLFYVFVKNITGIRKYDTGCSRVCSVPSTVVIPLYFSSRERDFG